MAAQPSDYGKACAIILSKLVADTNHSNVRDLRTHEVRDGATHD
jgi:hypothetical protein